MSPRSAIVAIGIGALLAAPSATAAPSKLQTTFRSALLADAATTATVKAELRSGTAVIDPKPLVSDLTGDGKADAIVPLLSGGAAGTIAVYVLSTDGSAAGRLHIVFASQKLRRATVAVGKGPTLVLDSPRYSPGDAVCCAAKVIRRTYAWARATRTMRLRSSRISAGPRTPPALPKPANPPATTTPTVTTPTATTTTPTVPGGGATAP